MLIVTTVAGSFGDDNLPGTQASERGYGCFDYRRMRVNHPLGVKFDQVRFQYDSFSFQIQLEQMDSMTNDILQRSLITPGLQNRDPRSRWFPISISVPTN